MKTGFFLCVAIATTLGLTDFSRAAEEAGVSSSSGPVQSSGTQPGMTGNSLLPGMSDAPVSSTGVASSPDLESAAGAEGPWEIGEIRMDGNFHVKEKAIRKQIRAREGQIYSRSDADKDIQSLVSMGSFDKVSVDLTPIPGRNVAPKFLGSVKSAHPARLTFLLAEKPRIRKIKFEGNQEFSRSKLADEISLKAKDPFDEIKLRADIAKLLALYHEQGYGEAQVREEARRDIESRELDLILHIEEGPQARIKEVVLSGLTAFKPKKILKLMQNRRKKVFNAEQFEKDKKEIEDYFKNRGFTEFEIADSSVTMNAEKTEYTLRLSFQEGPQSRFGKTTFSGSAVYSPRELEKTIVYRQGKIFSQEKFMETVANIQEKYADKGYLRARVDAEKLTDPVTKWLNIEFKVSEGDLVYVDHIDVEGNKATKTYVLRREAVQKEEEVFSASKIRKSRQRMMNLGFLDDVQLDIQPSPLDLNKVDLTFEVFEGKPGMLTAGAGFSSFNGLVGTLSLTHLNLLGRGYRTNVAWQFGRRVQDFSISWTTPWVRDKPISLGFDVFNTRRVRPFANFESGFVDKRQGGSVRVGPRFEDDKYAANFAYTFQKVTVFDTQSIAGESLTAGTSITSSISAEFVRDTRDNIWDPVEGTRNSASIELSGGPILRGDVHYYQPGVRSAFYKTLFSVGDYPFVWSINNRAGFIKGFSTTKDIPVFNRFFVGGADSVRGYDVTGQVGVPTGGKVMYVSNMEFTFPLARERKHTIVQWAFFADVGGVWRDFSSVRFKIGNEELNLKSSVGFGIRFTTPAFPIRLDWGYGLNHRPGESQGQVHFAIGNIAF
ncbi:MAG: outer membrane protein assembly factor BamA [Elusimicrobia bacterium RIFCSPLOWO2_12_FULL_59_9]|nr:MAG: outer membrane protein assembly factor BamA [Elusimicrobia bacterium RIFCSPLOWO2_12_FULL_59_9]